MLWLLLHIVLFAWLSYKVFQAYKSSPLHWYYWPALVLKITFGIGTGLLYFFYYGQGDIFNYHQDASQLAALALQEPAAYLSSWLGSYPEGLELVYSQQERALLTAKIFSLFYILTNSNFWLASVWVSFLAFLASFHLTNRLLRYRPFLQKAAPLAFLFWPSHVFWTSGLLKESLAMGCMAFITATILPSILAGKRLMWKEVLLSILLFFLLFKIKYYYAAVFGPFAGGLLLVCWLKRRFAWKTGPAFLAFVFLLVAGAGLASLLHPNLYPSRFLQVWVENYYLLARLSEEGSYVVFEGLQADWASILTHAPKAVAAGLFAPLLPAELSHPLRLAAGIENALLLLLSLLAVAGCLLHPVKKVKLIPLLVLLYVLVFALLIALAAPNYGTLLRYRVSYHPFYVLLVLTGVKYFIAWLLQKVKTRSGEKALL